MRRRATGEGVLVLDDTSLPKQGRHSEGVARLYLPTEWTEYPAHMAKAGVPPDRHGFREKWCIALDLLDEMKPQLPAYQTLVSL